MLQATLRSKISRCEAQEKAKPSLSHYKCNETNAIITSNKESVCYYFYNHVLSPDFIRSKRLLSFEIFIPVIRISSLVLHS